MSKEAAIPKHPVIGTHKEIEIKKEGEPIKRLTLPQVSLLLNIKQNLLHTYAYSAIDLVVLTERGFIGVVNNKVEVSKIGNIYIDAIHQFIF